MSTAFRNKSIRQQSYTQRVLRDRHRAEMGGVKLVGVSMKGSSEVVYDIIRHCIMMAGIIGLVAITIGATTESAYYHRILNWVSAFFIS